MTQNIPVKTPKEIAVMRVAGKKLAEIMAELKAMVQPGIVTKDLDRKAENLILKAGGRPAFKGYQGFPACLCTSVNEQIVHTPPSDYRLKAGDLLTLDLGINYKGFFADMAVSLIVPSKNSSFFSEKLLLAKRLLRTTKKALKLAIKKTKPGRTVGDIANVIQRTVEYQGFNVIRELCGHGIGRELHEPPQIPNFGQRRKGPRIKEGMVFCLEPMTSIGDWHLKRSPDGYGFETKDGSLSCHFEHTVLVTSQGSEILTQI